MIVKLTAKAIVIPTTAKRPTLRSPAGLRSVGLLAVVGMTMALAVSFTIMPALLQILHDRRLAQAQSDGDPEP